MTNVEKCLKRAYCSAARFKRSNVARFLARQGTRYAWRCLSFVEIGIYDYNHNTIYAIYKDLTAAEKEEFRERCPFEVNDVDIKYPTL